MPSIWPPTDYPSEGDYAAQRIRTIAFWTTTIFGPASFVIGGVLSLTRPPEVIATMNHLGYPADFAAILGAWKLLGAVVITAPGLRRLKEWAYAGFFFDLTAAAPSRAAVGDGAGDVITPLVFLALVFASWALRPPSRMLAPRQADCTIADCHTTSSASLFPELVADSCIP